ncbi:alpha/beta hydrolase fold domain-containing protein [Epidermidibacterium keratini]|uniref:Alpha/beta hydrolase fold domain-containing protein n=1 Tax=Epidermidibacterium keratini TaxID=1891644 RepID=A0A7L4YP81_9ACTN|nr:alpha/beta hydrolase [Epidermidibacterium keratini]QHC00367.1 alpha/beta hydrolase fold domain-containing protein [Epidermidibacterium keratini]
MRTRVAVLVSLVVATLVAACGSSDDSSLKVTENVRYADDSLRQQLDLYVPDDDEKSHPVAIYLHGGGWQLGDKAAVNDTAVANIKEFRDALLDAGYAVAAVNYRLTDEAIWPAQIQDVKSAVRYLRANAGKYNLDPERVVVWGESAGGHLAQMMAVTNGDPTMEGTVGQTGESSDVSAAISYYGISDLVTTATDVMGCSQTGGEVGQSKLVGGSPSVEPAKTLATLASPINYVDASDAPILLMHGKQDCVVAPIQSERMYSKLQSVGVPTDLVEVDGEHSAPVFFDTKKLQQQAIDWFSEYAA